MGLLIANEQGNGTGDTFTSDGGTKTLIATGTFDGGRACIEIAGGAGATFVNDIGGSLVFAGPGAATMMLAIGTKYRVRVFAGAGSESITIEEF